MNKLLKKMVLASLTRDLRTFKYDDHPLSGYCYVASEAYYYLSGGKDAGYIPQVINTNRGTHWYLKNKSGEIIDLTKDQFKTTLDYSNGRGKGFLTKKPSRRASVIINRVRKLKEQLGESYEGSRTEV